MRNITAIVVLIIIFNSCAKQSDVDCLAEKIDIIEYYDDLIKKAANNRDQQDRFREEKEKKLAELDC